MVQGDTNIALLTLLDKFISLQTQSNLEMRYFIGNQENNLFHQ